jgi:hypothetical protein
LVAKEKEVFTMTRMGKVLLAVLVLMLVCSPAIGSDTTNIKDKDIKAIKVYVNKNTGKVVGIEHKKDDGSDVGGTPVPITTPGTIIGSMLFHKSSPGCIVYVTPAGYAWEVCW